MAGIAAGSAWSRLTQGDLYETPARAGLHPTSIAGNKANFFATNHHKKRKTFENRKVRSA
jgi:hypothetical protein